MKIPRDAPKRKVIKALETLGFKNGDSLKGGKMIK